MAKVLSGVAVILTAGLLSISPAYAADEVAGAAPETGGLEMVVVTAQKRQQNEQDVGMSISATSGQNLIELGVSDPSQLVKVVPGFNYTPSKLGTPVFSIR